MRTNPTGAMAGQPRNRHRIGLLAIPALSTAFGYIGGQVIDQPLGMAGFGLFWGLVITAFTPSLARAGSCNPTQANLPVYIMLPLACIVLGGSLLAHIVGSTPANLLPLLEHPGYGLFFYSIHGLFEWVLMPWALIVNWHHPARRRLLIVAAVMFYAARLASALYFAPNAIAWGNDPSAAVTHVDDVALWIRLDRLRVIIQDLVIAAIMLIAALHPRLRPFHGRIARTRLEHSEIY
jgi:hypothetical protein